MEQTLSLLAETQLAWESKNSLFRRQACHGRGFKGLHQSPLPQEEELHFRYREISINVTEIPHFYTFPVYMTFQHFIDFL